MREQEENAHPIKVSVVVPVYNVERYIARCISDLTRQTLRDIEIICVDDGSDDASGKLLDELAATDGRIRVIHQANAGAGAARNAGLAVATGEYVFFFDPDDSCSRHMLKGMYRRAKRMEADIVIAGKCIYDAESGKLLNKYGFHRNIWTFKQPFSGQDMAEYAFTLAKSVPWDKLFRRQFVEDNGLRFQNTRRSNDVFFVNMALALAKRIALVPHAYYRYSRDRIGSLQSNKDKTPLVFLEAYTALEAGLRARGLFQTFARTYARTFWRSALFNLRRFREYANVEACYGRVRSIMLRLQPEVDLSTDFLLPIKYVALYRMMLADPSPEAIRSALVGKKTLRSDMDDDMDEDVGRRWSVKKLVRLLLPIPLREFIKFVRVRIWGNGVNLGNRTNEQLQAYIQRSGSMVVDFMHLSRTGLKVEMSYSVYGDRPPDALPGNAELVCEAQGVTRSVQVVPGCVFRPHGKAGAVGRRFSFEIPLACGTPCSLAWSFGDGAGLFTWKFMKYGPYAPLMTERATSYFRQSGWIVRRAGERLDILPDVFLARTRCRLAALVKAIVRPSRAAVQSCALRVAVGAIRMARRRPLWLVSDRPDRADDNGRAFFEYMCSLPASKSKPKCVFAIRRSSPDFKDLSKVGPCVDMDGAWYKMLFLSSDAIVSAYRTGAQRCPFSARSAAFLKWFFAFRYRFFFIRHGIGINDMAFETARHHINARVMTATSSLEYQADLDEACGYTPREIKLCGMARYDKLYDDRKSFITFMPTWRSYISVGVDKGLVQPTEAFANSRFCKNYSAILGDDRFVEECARFGYKVRVMPHPNLRTALPLMKISPSVEIVGAETSYRTIFATSDLIVTDYSSAVFDFAYLKKPVLYFQFDQDEFFSLQYKRGYYDWSKHGFGEVETDAEAVKARIVEYMDGGCRMKPEFQKRVDDFFAFTDKDNCKRIYEAILEAAHEDGIGGKA